MLQSFSARRDARGAIAAILLFATCAACASSYASNHLAIREVREFPEYGGFLPVDVEGAVLPELVVPARAADGSEDWSAPATAEEARRRIERSDVERKDARSAMATLGEFALLPVGILALGVARTWPESDASAGSARYLEEHGIPVEMRVVDSAGRPVAAARVRAIPASASWASYSLAPGRRSLASVGERAWGPGEALLGEMSRHVPVRLGREVRVKDRHQDSSVVEERVRLGEKDDFFEARGDDAGLVRWTSLASADSGAASARGLHVFVWAPGFEPSVVSASDAAPRVALRIDATLRPATDGERVRGTCTRLLAATDAVSKAVDVRILSVSVDGDRLIAALRTAQEIAADATLPEWLRWNASRILADLAARVPELTSRHSDNLFGGKDGSRQAADEDAVRAKAFLARLPDLGSPWLGDDRNPWRLGEAIRRWVGDASRVGMDPGPAGDARAATQARLVDDARGLLARGEALDPSLPELEPLRAALALAAGDRAAALEHAWLLDTPRYFRLFHGGLRRAARD